MEKDDKEKIIQSIKKNYMQMERSIVEQLYMEQQLHGTTIGTLREDIWAELFRMLLPKKFEIEHSAFIIDSKEGVSKEVDLVIFDEMYTPYIFHYGRLKFIPIEAVAAVVECKSKKMDEEGLKDWCVRLEGLKTSNQSLVIRLATSIQTEAVKTQQSTRPIRILCAMTKPSSDLRNLFDFILIAEEKSMHIEIMSNPAIENIFEWYKELNLYQEQDRDAYIKKALGVGFEEKIKYLKGIKLKDYQISKEGDTENALLSFNFQLNQLLMLINNPMLFPRREYVKMFSGRKEGADEG